ncbi:zinc ribbon-containing protein [Vibrio sp. DW001]|uniref:zinc ribbon-containing protein n=1 Tax=unclassified Vibrio TaxID=2614977 RepID=UPI0018A0B8FF|nr:MULTISPECIES: zinc ribbon-containing protein [unclassified Vibrio]UGA54116.1 zinc ribbon-containing protein [Vibrio sp. VB16]WED25987.1 zinc ribbon-containing protein [Vibrio sp. DW001]
MPKRKLGYEEKFEEVVEALKQSPEELKKALETSGEVAHAASDMTKDEIALVSAYVKSDLKEFADNYQESKESPFSIMVADSIWQALLDITDRTKVEWVELFEDLEHQGVYQVGDVIGLGHLICEKCGQKTRYIHPTTVHSCSKCGGQAFTRVSLKP